MRLQSIPQAYKPRVQRKGKVQEFIEEFEDSGEDIMEVSFAPTEYTSEYNCTTVLEQSIKSIHKESVLKAFTMHHKVYIAKKSYLESRPHGMKALDI